MTVSIGWRFGELSLVELSTHDDRIDQRHGVILWKWMKEPQQTTLHNLALGRN
jgi:hypothetical protein